MILNPVNEDLLEEKATSQLSEEALTSLTQIELEEMAGLKKASTGLPVNIWLDCGKAYIQGGHGKRIKFQNDYGNSTNENNLLPMTISRDDPHVPEKLRPKIQLKKKDIDAIKNFVKNNARELEKLSDDKIDIAMFLKKMKT